MSARSLNGFQLRFSGEPSRPAAGAGVACVISCSAAAFASRSALSTPKMARIVK